MRTPKIAITIDRNLLAQVDQLVKAQRYPSRSRAIQEAIRNQLDRLSQNRLVQECAKLEPRLEQALADEGLADALKQWPVY